MKKAIIISVYLRMNQPQELPDLEGLKLAKRAIESLKILEDQDFMLLLPVCLELSSGDQEVLLSEMDRFIRKELGYLRKGNTLIFSSYHLKNIREYLNDNHLKDFSSLIDLKGFSKIRNTGLLIAQALLMDVVIFIDNDEVVEDPHYLGIACDYLDQEWNGKLVSGKGGFYVNPDGTILLPPRRLWWDFLWDKTKWMNRAWERILSSRDRLVPASMVLGGNLVLHRSLFQTVPFDPCIPRGEDTDYLINASRFGFIILFDKELRIKHLHPERTEVFFQDELRGDIERFIYEREKIEEALDIDLDPYPGHFLKWTLYPKAMFTSLLLSFDYLLRREGRKAKECIDNFNLIFRKDQGGWLKYLTFKGDWERVMEKIEKGGLDEILEDCWI